MLHTGETKWLQVAALALATFTLFSLVLIVIGAALQQVPLIVVGVVFSALAILGDLFFLLRFASEIREGILIGQGSRQYKLRGRHQADSPASTARLRPSTHRNNGSAAVLQNVTTTDQTDLSFTGPGPNDMPFSRYNSLLHRLPSADIANQMSMFGDIQHAVTCYESESAVESPLPEIVEETVSAPLRPLDGTQLVTLASLGPMASLHDADTQHGDITPISQSTPRRSLEQSRSSSPSIGDHRHRQDVLENQSKLISRTSDDRIPNMQHVSHQQSTSGVISAGTLDSARSSTATTYTIQRLFEDGSAKNELAVHQEDNVFEETAT